MRNIDIMGWKKYIYELIRRDKNIFLFKKYFLNFTTQEGTKNGRVCYILEYLNNKKHHKYKDIIKIFNFYLFISTLPKNYHNFLYIKKLEDSENID
jgi:hypothetical protein